MPHPKPKVQLWLFCSNRGLVVAVRVCGAQDNAGVAILLEQVLLCANALKKGVVLEANKNHGVSAALVEIIKPFFFAVQLGNVAPATKTKGWMGGEPSIG